MSTDKFNLVRYRFFFTYALFNTSELVLQKMSLKSKVCERIV